MDGRIGHLHCRYRFFGDRSQAGAVTARLERVAQHNLVEAYTDALNHALGDDPIVHIVRRVHSRATFPLSSIADDNSLSKRWGEKLAGSVAQSLADGDGSTDNVISFPNQVAFVVQFLQDLLAGEAWRRWYYGAFWTLQPLTVPQAILRVLFDHTSELDAILTELTRRGLLSKLLACLGAAETAVLWSVAVKKPVSGTVDLSRLARELLHALAVPGGDIETLAKSQREVYGLLRARLGPIAAVPLASLLAEMGRLFAEDRADGTSGDLLEVDESAAQDAALFAEACRLVERLQLWRQSPPSQQALMVGFRPPGLTDWKDPKSLASYVERALLHLQRQGWLKTLDADEAERLAANLPAILAEGFDYLGTGCLQSTLRPLVAGQDPDSREASDRSARASSRLRRSLADLAAGFDDVDTKHVQKLLSSVVGQGQGSSDARERIASDGSRQRQLLADLANGFDDLDTRRLEKLSPLVAAQDLGSSDASDLIARVSPKRRKLLTDIRLAIRRLDWPLAGPQAANAAQLKLALFIALLEVAPQWSGDSLAIGLVEILADQLLPLSDSLNLAHGPSASIQGVGSAHDRSSTPADVLLQLCSALGEQSLVVLAELHETVTGTERAARFSRCAGALLLLRAVADLRIPLLASGRSYPDEGSLQQLIVPLLVRLTGASAIEAGRLDAGLWSLVEPGASPQWSDWLESWRTVSNRSHRDFLAALWRVLAGQRILTGETLHAHRLATADGPILVIGDGSADCWPLWLWALDTDDGSTAQQVLSLWQDVYGRRPRRITMDAGLDWDDVAQELSCVSVPDAVPADAVEDTEEACAAHRANRAALDQALAALSGGELGLVSADVSVALIAIGIVRAWARWLPRFANSSLPYLLNQLIRRDGRIRVQDDAVEVELEPAALDVLIEMAGYTAEMEQLDWLGRRRLRFRIRR